LAVGLAYSALVLRDQGLAAEVNHLEDRLDEMKERLELWGPAGCPGASRSSGLRGLLHLAQAAEEIGDAAQQLVWLVEEGEELHPSWPSPSHADEVVVRCRWPPARRPTGSRSSPSAWNRDRVLPARHPPGRPLPVPPRAAWSSKPATT